MTTHDKKVFDRTRVVCPPGVRRTGDIGYLETPRRKQVVKVPGPEALTGAVTAAVRLVVLAATYPGESAAGVAAALRSRVAPPAGVLLANGNDPAVRASAAADPGVRVVHKPFLPTELVVLARQLVGPGKPPARASHASTPSSRLAEGRRRPHPTPRCPS